MYYVSLILFLLLTPLLNISNGLCAEKFNPIVIYQEKIETNPYNYAIHQGVQQFVQKTGSPCKEIVIGGVMENYLKTLDEACASGYSPIFLIYANHLKKLHSYAKEHPNIRFLILGKVTDIRNVLSFDFAEHEGSFLAGALAAMKSKTKIIGFVSVSELPLMHRFLCGYKQGAKYINPDTKVLSGFIGTYHRAWFDGNATAALANKLMDQGADVIYQAAGGAGQAVLEAAAKRGKLGIGVDTNQNGLYPGHVLTSMEKHTDKIVFAALLHAKRGIWRDNIKSFGLVQDAVGLAFDENNAKLVTPSMKQKIVEIRNKISLGEIKVHDYVTDETCPE
jgi:basic membrane protein A